MVQAAPRDIATLPVSRNSGQALIETALVMPLFVFIILGTLQLSLMHQAHAMTKYAAYKAVRTGSIRSAKTDAMERAAVAVLLPMISFTKKDGHESIKPITDAFSYGVKATELLPNRMPPLFVLKYVEVKICGPLIKNARNTQGIDPVAQKAGNEVQFDAPRTVTKMDWLASEATKLRVEVTFNYRLPIPFANMMIYWITRGQEDAELMWVMRMSEKQTELTDHQWSERFVYDEIARNEHDYILPIRATYAMRMMSDLYPDKSGFELPKENTCHIPFPHSGSDE